MRIFWFFIGLSFFLFKQENITSQGYRLRFDIKGAAGLEAQLAYYMGDNKYIFTKGNFDNKGRLTLEGQDKIPAGIYLLIVGKSGYFDILIRNEQFFSISSDTSDFIRKMKVKDSKENELFFSYQLKVLEYKSLLSEYEKLLKNKDLDSVMMQDKKTKKLSVEKELNQFVEAIKTKNKGTYLSKILSAMDSPGFEQFPFSDSELLRTPFYHNYIRLFIKKNIEKNSSYIIQETDNFLDSLKNSEQCYRYTAGYLLNFYNNFYRNGINAIFVHIADNYFLPDKANWLVINELEQIKKRRDFLAQGLPGNNAQDLILESNTGEYLSLLQVNAKTTFLYFWSTGCGHCTKATQILNENYKALKNKNIEIYAVNVEKNKEDWLKKIEENKLPWINCIDVNEDSDYRDKYYVYGSPLLIIIDSEKKIIAILNGEIEIENAVKQILK